MIYCNLIYSWVENRFGTESKKSKEKKCSLRSRRTQIRVPFFFFCTKINCRSAVRHVSDHIIFMPPSMVTLRCFTFFVWFFVFGLFWFFAHTHAHEQNTVRQFFFFLSISKFLRRCFLASVFFSLCVISIAADLSPHFWSLSINLLALRSD